MNNPFSRGGYAIQMYIYSFTVFICVWGGLKCRHTALGNPQTQSLKHCSSGGPEQSQRARARTWLLGRGAGWCHTCSGTLISFIYSSNQKNRLGAAEYQLIVLPGPMSGCLKCHWVGRLCISFTARLQEALKQVGKAPSGCPATYQGEQVQSCQVGWPSGGWELPVITNKSHQMLPE